MCLFEKKDAEKREHWRKSMIDTKKEQERDQLHRAIRAIADELRGAVDGWDFKNYVLGTMFYRYISENLCSYINNGEIEAGTPDFDYAEMPDDEAEEARDGLVEEKGFFILPSELFCNVLKRADNDENLNETLEAYFGISKSRQKVLLLRDSLQGCLMTTMSTATSWVRRFLSGTKSW